jgi:hypothetical protein
MYSFTCLQRGDEEHLSSLAPGIGEHFDTLGRVFDDIEDKAEIPHIRLMMSTARFNSVPE